MQPDKKSIRDSNIEFLRITLMLMIICHHMIVHGAHIELLSAGTFKQDNNTTYYLFANSFFVIGVDGFIFISGYYGIKVKLKGLVQFFVQVIFYSLLILVLSKILLPSRLGIRTIVDGVFPVSSGRWWFITAYIFLYALSPMLNLAIETLDKKHSLLIIIALGIMINFSGFIFDPSVLGVHNGYSLNNMIFIYLLGRYIRKYVNMSFIEKYASILYVGLSITVFGLANLSLIYVNQKLAWQVFAYNNPLLLLSAISFFYIFKKIKLQSPFINAVAGNILAVYLLHSNSLSAKYLYTDVFKYISNSNFIIHLLSIIGVGIAVLSLSITIEHLRKWAFNSLNNKLSNIGHFLVQYIVR